jgi:hypothetical protein
MSDKLKSVHGWGHRLTEYSLFLKFKIDSGLRESALSEGSPTVTTQ